ncbi:hypothetical protein EG68_06692 [Paragonimus skrjabini miyazakii]|uniref:Uncharacterized protein n=1 Tax=Paragonimus skrjabini miyazakii TaxID=59628 RepID=A0A8S9YFU6_9TREM|nr:hypothetical protein EG68_06692 [Paragonimus skrjabini miyazakii]
MDNSTGACSALFSCLQEDAVSTLPSVIASGTDHLLSRVDLILGGSTQLLSPIPLMHLTYPNLLHAAVWYSAHECLVYLLQDGFLRDLDKPSGEGLTPLHLAAAVGDFVAVNHLLEAGASVEIFDHEGRTPLHYAIGTDMRVVVQLCSRNASCLQIPDHYNKTPYNLATEYQDTLAAHFFITLMKVNRGLLSHTELSMEARMMSMKSNLKEGSLWIPFNLKAPICVKPARDLYGGNVFCACNLPVSEHEPLSRNTTLLQRFAKYKSRFVLGPTNTFGEIEHAAINFVSPYVRISDTVEISKLSHLFETVWSMERPQLVLSFYGDEVNSTQLKESIRKLIWKISGSTVTWIITDGMQQSISPVVSEAIKQYIEAYGEGLVEALGVVHWRRACALEGLTSPEYTGCYPARCTAMKETSALHGDLDTNMTHYLFVDSGECTLDQSTLEFRSKLEAFLHNWSCSDHLDDVNMLKQVQTCGILSGGNENTLNAIHSLVKDNMPIILLKNSGGLADILIVCLEDTEVGQRNLHKRAVTEGSRDSEIFRLSPANIRQAVLTYWERMEKPDIVVLLIQELLESSKMLCIYDAEEDELDYHVLLLLLGPTEDAATANVEAQFSKLEIAIALNRSDVAREKVFLDGLKWDNDRLGSYMMSFLLQENVEFTKLFLEKGFDLKAYVTCETMERLYTYSVRRATQRRALVNVIRHLVKLPERINLLLIGKVLTLLMGNRYFPVYLEPNFAKTVETEKREKMPNCPATHLFIWALLTERNDTAAFFWTQTQEPLGAALMAACLLRRFARFADSLVNREELIEFSNSYEDKAHGLLTECYSQDPANTSELLIRERSLFGQISCIMLASDGNSMSFISHRCSEQFLERTWCGAIDQHARRFTFFISLITGIVMPPLVPFTIKFNLEATKQPIEKNGKDTKSGPLSRMAKNSKLLIDDDLTTEAESPKEKCRNYLRKIYAFYYSPSVRFSYATVSFSNVSLFIFRLSYSRFRMFKPFFLMRKHKWP